MELQNATFNNDGTFSVLVPQVIKLEDIKDQADALASQITALKVDIATYNELQNKRLEELTGKLTELQGYQSQLETVKEEAQVAKPMKAELPQ